MKQLNFILLMMCVVYIPCNVMAQQKRVVVKHTTVTSPDKKILVDVSLDNNQKLIYSIKYNGKAILQNSALGIIREDADFSTAMQWLSASEQTIVKDNYKILNAKKSNITYIANKKIIAVQNKNGDAMQVIFQLSNDGVAFRWQEN